MVMTESIGNADAETVDGSPFDGWRLRKNYEDYLRSKRAEIDEQRVSRRYYHGDQWTREQLLELKRRNQPPITSNVVSRKINGLVGLMERLRQDPKAYPRTPQHQKGADLATAVLRYCLDVSQWEQMTPEISRQAANEGIGGVEMELVQLPSGDHDTRLKKVDNEYFFYDQTSFKPDFADARYMGTAKWVQLQTAIELFPDKAETLRSLVNHGDQTASYEDSDQDQDKKWTDVNRKRLRMVDHWFKWRNVWYWAVHIGATIIAAGVSPFISVEKESIPKFLMFSAMVDQDGDRYGFVRNLQSPQDEINHHKSKFAFQLAANQFIGEQGAVDDIDKFRQEAARADGIALKNPGRELIERDKTVDLQGHIQLLEQAKQEVAALAPDPAALNAQGERAIMSGRAISLIQQAGLAELGPFLLCYRAWKLRVYRSVWSNVQRFWKAQRYIRVTDDEDLIQWIEINGIGRDDFGRLQAVNMLGQVDVDIILDEGADTINMMQDAFEALTQSGMDIPPDIWLELAPLDARLKKRLLEKLQQAQEQQGQSAQMLQQQQMIEMANRAAEVDETRSKTALNIAKAQDTGSGNGATAPGPLDLAAQAADIGETRSKTALNMAKVQDLSNTTPQMDFFQRAADLEKTASETDLNRAKAVNELQNATIAV